MNNNFGENQSRDYQETVIQVRRVSKKTKGGNQIRFSVLVVVGDRKGKVGPGVGKAPDVVSAIRKAIAYAKKRMVAVPLRGTTIPYEVRVKHGAARILLKPAPNGSGIIAGGPLRAVIEASGIRDIVAKMLGSNNKTANVYAVIEAFRQMSQLASKKEVKNESSPTS